MSKILTVEEAQILLQEKNFVTTIHIDIEGAEAVFFSNDHCHARVTGVDNWALSITYFTCHEYGITPRFELPSGAIHNIEQFIKVFLYDTKILWSEKELIDFIIEKKPYMANAFQ